MREVKMYGWAAIPLRLGLGTMFIGHGLQKAFGLFNGPGIKGFSDMLAGMGFTQPVFWAYVAAYTELIGGICLIIGLGTRISAALLFTLIVVAGVTVHIKNGFFLGGGGIEYVLIIACACLSLLILGTGKFGICSKF
jgi:putative oxidoreductase